MGESLVLDPNYVVQKRNLNRAAQNRQSGEGSLGYASSVSRGFQSFTASLWGSSNSSSSHTNRRNSTPERKGSFNSTASRHSSMTNSDTSVSNRITPPRKSSISSSRSGGWSFSSLLAGVGAATLGAVARPLSGALDLVAETSRGLM